MKSEINDQSAQLIKDIGIGAVDLGFDYRAGQIGYSVANGSPPLRRFFGAVLVRAELWRWTPPFVTRFGVILRI